MRRLAVVPVVLGLAAAASGVAEGTSSPPEIALRLGAASTDRVCWIAGRYKGVGPDGAAFGGSAKRLISACRAFPSLRVRRAQRLRITLRDPASTVTATWYARGTRAAIGVQATGGQAPASAWVLSVPPVGGRLVLSVSFPPQPAPNGGVWELGTDYRVVVRRAAAETRR